MIAQPDWISAGLVNEALATARTRRRLPALDRIRFEDYAEGLSVQTLHVGSFDDEGPVLEQLHHEFITANGLIPTGRHHEIYLSDARKTAPAKLRTILRQPVGPEPPA